jgi:hypothetical protein
MRHLLTLIFVQNWSRTFEILFQKFIILSYIKCLISQWKFIFCIFHKRNDFEWRFLNVITNFPFNKNSLDQINNHPYQYNTREEKKKSISVYPIRCLTLLWEDILNRYIYIKSVEFLNENRNEIFRIDSSFSMAYGYISFLWER